MIDPDGVSAVRLEYQLEDPGNYIANSNQPTKPIGSRSYSCMTEPLEICSRETRSTPPNFPPRCRHRRLVRYRVQVAGFGRADRDGARTADDPQPNFAYFVYDGVPEWSGAIQPASTDPARSARVIYGTSVMRRVPAYHLISRKADVDEPRGTGVTGAISTNGKELSSTTARFTITLATARAAGSGVMPWARTCGSSTLTGARFPGSRQLQPEIQNPLDEAQSGRLHSTRRLPASRRARHVRICRAAPVRTGRRRGSQNPFRSISDCRRCTRG